MISDDYRALNVELHERQPKYGTGGAKWAPVVCELARYHPIEAVLDYGCGKGDFKRAMRGTRIAVREYDPAIPGKDVPPGPADLVLCVDVMEHVELEHVAAVIDHVLTLSNRVALFSICIVEGSRRLPDGRPAHITVRGDGWWAAQLEAAALRHGFTVYEFACKRDDTRTWLLTRLETRHGNR